MADRFIDELNPLSAIEGSDLIALWETSDTDDNTATKSGSVDDLVAYVQANISTAANDQECDEFIDVANGTTSLTLNNTPTEILEVERNGLELSSTDYSLSLNILTLAVPAGASAGATNLEDFKVTYRF